MQSRGEVGPAARRYSAAFVMRPWPGARAALDPAWLAWQACFFVGRRPATSSWFIVYCYSLPLLRYTPQLFGDACSRPGGHEDTGGGCHDTRRARLRFPHFIPPHLLTSLESPGGAMLLTKWRDCALGDESSYVPRYVVKGGRGVPGPVCSRSGGSWAWRNTRQAPKPRLLEMRSFHKRQIGVGVSW